MLFNWAGTVLFIIILVSISMLYKPDDADMVRLWIKSGNIKKALDLVEKSDFRDADKPGAIKLRGLVNEKAGKISRARIEYTSLLKHRGSEGHALRAIYRIDMSLGELESAYSSLKQLFERKAGLELSEVVFLLSRAIEKNDMKFSRRIIGEYMTDTALSCFKKGFFKDYIESDEKPKLLLLLDYHAEMLTGLGKLDEALNLYMLIGTVRQYEEYLAERARDNVDMISAYINKPDMAVTYYEKLFKESLSNDENSYFSSDPSKGRTETEPIDYNALRRHIILARNLITPNDSDPISKYRLSHVKNFWSLLVRDFEKAVSLGMTDKKYMGMTYNRYMALRNAAFLFQSAKDQERLTRLFTAVEKAVSTQKSRTFTFYEFELLCDTAELMLNSKEYERADSILKRLVPELVPGT